MRKINPNKVPIPREINYSEIQNELSNISSNPAYKAVGKIYRGEVKDSGKHIKKVAIALRDKYDGKCGYCESIERDPKVEHHRPVGKVSEGRTNNNGYYWLCYEWTNMVASCTDCNNTPCKGIQYPITLSRMISPPLNQNGDLDISALSYSHSDMLAEGGLILHPEFMDDPSNHFKYNSDGEIIGLTDKGIASKEIYGLDRDTLNVQRRHVYIQFHSRIKKLIRRRFRLINPISNERFIEEVGEVFGDLLERIQNEHEHSYTLFSKSMLTNFEHFFIDPFDPVIHTELKAAYINVTSGLIGK